MADNIKAPVREYRRGIQYRNGDVSKESVLKEFRFSDIKYSKGYTDADKNKVLNYAYDSLKDLADVLDIPLNSIALPIGEKGERPQLYFGISDKSNSNLVISKSANVSRSWFILLNKFLGNAFDNERKEFIQVLKLKQNVSQQDSQFINNLNAIRKDIIKLLDQMPIKKSVDVEEVLFVENSREVFLANPNEENFYNMINTFESNGVDLKGVKDKLDEKFESVKELRNEQNKVVDFVNTNYYTSAKDLDSNKGENESLFSSEVGLMSYIFSWYIMNILKERNQYNNYLVTNPMDFGLVIPVDEGIVYKSAIQKYLSVVLPYVVEEMMKYSENENVEMSVDSTKENVDAVKDTENNEGTTVKNIMNSDVNNTMLSDSSTDEVGKFNLPYFKMLASQAGLNVEKGKSEKLGKDCYYIYFTKSYIEYLKVPSYSNPQEKGHCIEVNCGKAGSIKEEYIWDNELNYSDLIDFLKKIEVEHNELKGEKFKLTYFKEACSKHGFKVDEQDSKLSDNKHYRILFKNHYISYVDASISYEPKNENTILIKTMCEEVYHVWRDNLNYEVLILKLIEIEKQGKAQIEEEINKLKKEKEETIKKYKEVKKERDESKVANNTSDRKVFTLDSLLNMKQTKDYRDNLNLYLKEKGYIIDRNVAFNEIYDILSKNLVSNEVALNIVLDTISEDKLMGKSKAWSMKNSEVLVLQRRLNQNKLSEGLLEGFITYYLRDKKYSKVQKQMLTETLTYMLCKMYHLDVRTYCMDKSFENFIRADNIVKKNYFKLSFKLFDEILYYFI